MTGRRAETGFAGTVLPCRRQRGRDLPGGGAAGFTGTAQGPTGCGKTRFVEAMAHELGRELITVAGHEDMTVGGPRRPLPAQGRRDRLGGRSADPGRAGGRHLLSRRDRRSPPGHHRRHPSARRPPPRTADRPAGHDTVCGAGLSARGLLQPRLPEHPQEPQGVDAPAVHRDQLGFPTADVETDVVAHEAGIDRADRAIAGRARRCHPRPGRVGAQRGGIDADADPRGRPRRRGTRPAGRGPVGRRRGAVRRRRT